MSNEFILMPRTHKIIDDRGNEIKSIRSLAKSLGVAKSTISHAMNKKGQWVHNGITYFSANPVGSKTVQENPVNAVEKILQNDKEYQDYLTKKNSVNEVKKVSFQLYDFKLDKKEETDYRYAVALFSDAHIEETVLPETVLGKNKYNVEIAEQRIKAYFQNLALCLNEDKVNELIFASLGDTISGYIHDELAQCNGLSPLKAVHKAQSLIYSGLKHIVDNTGLKHIRFIGIVGNHSRTTKKVQHSNGYEMSLEWLMYMNIKEQCAAANLPIDFYIPEAEIAIVETIDNRRLLFCHGFQIKGSGNGTVCGIYPALNRLSLKWGQNFGQDKIYLGHFHSCISIPNATVNGSIIGYNSFSLSNGFKAEEPAQMYEVYSTTIGLMVTRKIYCK
jgi:hypothetical protein